jgi:hypothetical protein
MRKAIFAGVVVVVLLLGARLLPAGASEKSELQPAFQTSDRCLACHNGLTTPAGKDVSIGLAWRASIMANSSRDPYWQASVRRESIDHPESRSLVEDECSICHMPMARYQAKLQGHRGQVFAHLPFAAASDESKLAEDGVSCSLCHQIGKEKLGTRESFNGGFHIDVPKSKNAHLEYGPFGMMRGQQRIMDTSTGGFRPTPAAHIRDSALCGTCHTLFTTALGKDGKELGEFPEQMPYLEWLHSDYPTRSSCQGCHMPQVRGPAPIAAVFGMLRIGARHHSFVGANFLMLTMLNRYRNDLSVAALPEELAATADETAAFLRSQAARITISSAEVAAGRLNAEIQVQNLTGHKLPTAYPSRRAWLHFAVADRDGRKVFESGALNRDGSIQGNDNDADPARYEPHYREITGSDQVQIYEPILRDEAGHVTTGLLSTIGYLKDNRLLPEGFQKATASRDIAVVGDAADDPDFVDGGDRVRYSITLAGAPGPFHIYVELLYQPIGFRWAHNLAVYKDAEEPRRFLQYYESMPQSTTIVLARAEASR